MTYKTAVEEVEAEAKAKGLIVDWETLKMIPSPLSEMTPHMRDHWASEEAKRQYYKDLNDERDEDPISHDVDWE